MDVHCSVLTVNIFQLTIKWTVPSLVSNLRSQNTKSCVLYNVNELIQQLNNLFIIPNNIYSLQHIRCISVHI